MVSSSNLPDQTRVAGKIRVARIVPCLLLATLAGWTLLSAPGGVRQGYGTLSIGQGSPPVVATALYSSKNSAGTLVSEAAVAGVAPQRDGIVIVDGTRSQTGIALVNPGTEERTFLFTLRNQLGEAVETAEFRLGGSSNRAVLVEDLFSEETGAGFLGSLSFEALSPGSGAAVVTIRVSSNGHGEPILSTLPVVPLATGDCGDAIFPHVGVAPELDTELILLNPAENTAQGSMRVFWTDGGTEDIPYRIEPKGVFKEVLTEDQFRHGFARLRPEGDSPCPSGTAIFSYSNPQGPVSEAGVPSVRLSRNSKLFLDYKQTETGVAIANPSSEDCRLDFFLANADGSPRSSPKTATLKAGQQWAVFAHELFAEIGDGDEGVLEIQSTIPVATLALKLTFDPERDEPILTTLPVADLETAGAAPIQALYFPQVAFGSQFETRFVLVNTDSTRQATATLAIFDETGSPLPPFADVDDSEFIFMLGPSGGRAFEPGLPMEQRQIAFVLLNPEDPALVEMAVAVGTSTPLHPVAVDSGGMVRRDVPLVLSVLDSDVARLDEARNLVAEGLGFTTLYGVAQGQVSTLAVTVTDPETIAFTNGGVDGNADTSLYYADNRMHAIFFAERLGDGPRRFCGLPGMPAYQDGTCDEARFDSPSQVHLNRAGGDLYVSDSGNHLIRRVYQGMASTVAGHPSAGGFSASSGLEETFNNPQGLALDPVGRLWVVDSADNVVRTVNLLDGSVAVLAGTPGVAGSGPSQFDRPMGISFEAESFAARLDRIDRGEPPRPPQMIVADTGNDRLQRVFADGRVETVVASASISTRISAPLAVASDGFGNIYFTESDQTKILLPDGRVTVAVPPGTITNPTSLLITGMGQVVIGNGDEAKRVTYRAPRVDEIEMDDPNRAVGSQVMLRGSDFAPESQVVLAGQLVTRASLVDARTIRFPLPSLPSGLSTLTVFHRGGYSQRPFFVPPEPLNAVAPGFVTTLGGGSTFAGDGSPAESALLDQPSALFIDPSHGVFLADSGNHRVRRIDENTAQINTVAGTGRPAFSGDGQPALATALAGPRGVTLDGQGNLFIADSLNNVVRRIDGLTGISTIQVGGGNLEVGPARQIALGQPQGVAVDSGGNLFISDTLHRRILRFDAATGMATLFAGGGDSRDEGISACKASLTRPTDVFLRGDYLYVVDCKYPGRVRRIPVAGAEESCDSMGIDTRPIETVAGSRDDIRPSSFASQVADVLMVCPEAIWVDGQDGLFIANSDDDEVVRVDLLTRTAKTLSGFSEVGQEPGNELIIPSGVAVDVSGNVFVSDQGNNRILRRSPDGTVDVFAGGSAESFLGDGGLAAAASLSAPSAMALDDTGDLFVADSENHRIRRLGGPLGDGSAIISTVVDATPRGNSPGAVAIAGQFIGSPLSSPQGVAFDGAHYLYFSDTGNHTIWRFDTASMALQRVAGTPGQPGFAGDDGPAVSAWLNYPQALAFDPQGRLLVADSRNNRIRRIDLVSGVIQTVAGDGELGFTGQNGDLAVEVRLQFPSGLAVDSLGRIFFTDTNNQRIRMVAPPEQEGPGVPQGRIYNLAGGGTEIGDAAVAKARFSYPEGLWIAGDKLLVADCGNDRVKMIDLGNLDLDAPGFGGLVVETLAGGTSASSTLIGDGGPASNARIFQPRGVITDGQGNLFVSEGGSGRIRAIRRLFE